jgi:hypothetical protein
MEKLILGKIDLLFINYSLLSLNQKEYIMKKGTNSLVLYLMKDLINSNNLLKPVSLRKMAAKMGLKSTTMTITLQLNMVSLLRPD